RLLAPSINCALIRTRPPALRTLPSSTCVTLSSRATFGTSTCLPLYRNEPLRDTTSSADTLLRSVMMSSLMPSLKYSCSGSPLMLTNGNTQIEKHAGSLPDAGGPEALAAFAACAVSEHAIIAANACRHSCAAG